MGKATIMLMILGLDASAQGSVTVGGRSYRDLWRKPVTEFWPPQAGAQLISVHHSAHTLQPWPGFGVMCLCLR